MLAMADVWLEQHGGYYAFCDTDSMAVSPFHWRTLQSFFQSLNPYDSTDPTLKLEHDEIDEDGKRTDLWFYGISAKRYVLYRMKNGQPEPVDDGWSSHGLGYLRHDQKVVQEDHDQWEKELWVGIINIANGKISEEELCDKYADQYAVSKYTVTSPILHRRLAQINRNKAYSKQVKPFNFILVGQPTENGDKAKPIHPITKFTTKINEAPFQSFIDYNSGKRYAGESQLYWKTLKSVIRDYLSHPEAKFGNGCSMGKMRRRHLEIDKIAYIGKEANELEDAELLGLDESSYVEYLPAITTDRTH
jgi:hypothetical protein